MAGAGRRLGLFQGPGLLAGVSDYMQHDCQTVFAHPSWKGVKLGDVTAAWYQREISVPRNGRAAASRFAWSTSIPAPRLRRRQEGRRGPVSRRRGRSHRASASRASEHVLSLRVIARPLQEVMLMFSDTNTARQGGGKVERRGLCGDVYLVGAPAAARIGDVKVGHLGPQGPDHAERGAGESGAATAIRAARRRSPTTARRCGSSPARRSRRATSRTADSN